MRKINLYRTVIFIAFALAVTVLSFHGTLDNFAHEWVSKTTNESLGIFALLIGLNAAISVIQSSEIGGVILSVDIGELLDPINDETERFSSAMVWALGSLFLQRIVLEVAAHSIFKWVFFAISLMTTATLLLCEIFVVSENSRLHRSRNLLVRIFITATILRFIVPLIVTISFLVSHLLLETEINKHKKDLSLFREQVSIDDNLPSSDDAQSLDEQKTLKASELDDLKERLASYLRESESLDAEIKTLSREIGWLRRHLPKNRASREELLFKKAKRKEISHEMQDVEDRIRAAKKELDCIERRLAGEDCDSLLDKLSDAASYERFKNIVNEAPDIVISIVKLLIALIVKNILLPIAFLMLVIKCSLPIVRFSAFTFKRSLKDSKPSLLKEKSEET